MVFIMFSAAFFLKLLSLTVDTTTFACSKKSAFYMFCDGNWFLVHIFVTQANALDLK